MSAGATGVPNIQWLQRDAMIAHATGAHLHIQHLSKEECQGGGTCPRIRSSCNLAEVAPTLLCQKVCS